MSMSTTTIIAIIQGGIKLIETVSILVAEARGVLNSDDQALIDAKLEELIAKNKTLFANVDTKLTEAAKDTSE